jgi:hypothetical protein
MNSPVLELPRYDYAADEVPQELRHTDCGVISIAMTRTHDDGSGAVPPAAAIQRLDQLERQGKLVRGRMALPEWFFTEPPPQFEGSVVEQLLADRRKHDW